MPPNLRKASERLSTWVDDVHGRLSHVACCDDLTAALVSFMRHAAKVARAVSSPGDDSSEEQRQQLSRELLTVLYEICAHLHLRSRDFLASGGCWEQFPYWEHQCAILSYALDVGIICNNLKQALSRVCYILMKNRHLVWDVLVRTRAISTSREALEVYQKLAAWCPRRCASPELYFKFVVCAVCLARQQGPASGWGAVKCTVLSIEPAAFDFREWFIARPALVALLPASSTPKSGPKLIAALCNGALDVTELLRACRAMVVSRGAGFCLRSACDAAADEQGMFTFVDGDSVAPEPEEAAAAPKVEDNQLRGILDSTLRRIPSAIVSPRATDTEPNSELISEAGSSLCITDSFLRSFLGSPSPERPSMAGKKAQERGRRAEFVRPSSPQPAKRRKRESTSGEDPGGTKGGKTAGMIASDDETPALEDTDPSKDADVISFQRERSNGTKSGDHGEMTADSSECANSKVQKSDLKVQKKGDQTGTTSDISKRPAQVSAKGTRTSAPELAEGAPRGDDTRTAATRGGRASATTSTQKTRDLRTKETLRQQVLSNSKHRSPDHSSGSEDSSKVVPVVRANGAALPRISNRAGKRSASKNATRLAITSSSEAESGTETEETVPPRRQKSRVTRKLSSTASDDSSGLEDESEDESEEGAAETASQQRRKPCRPGQQSGSEDASSAEEVSEGLPVHHQEHDSSKGPCLSRGVQSKVGSEVGPARGSGRDTSPQSRKSSSSCKLQGGSDSESEESGPVKQRRSVGVRKTKPCVIVDSSEQESCDEQVVDATVSDRRSHSAGQPEAGSSPGDSDTSGKPSRCLRSSLGTKNTRKSMSTGRAPGAKLTQQTDSDDSSATNDSSESCGETVIQKESGKPPNSEQQKKLAALSTSDQKSRRELSQSRRALRSSVDVTPSYARKLHPNRIVDSSEEDLNEDEAVKANNKKPASSSQSADEIPCGQQSPVRSQLQGPQLGKPCHLEQQSGSEDASSAEEVSEGLPVHHQEPDSGKRPSLRRGVQSKGGSEVGPARGSGRDTSPQIHESSSSSKLQRGSDSESEGSGPVKQRRSVGTRKANPCIIADSSEQESCDERVVEATVRGQTSHGARQPEVSSSPGGSDPDEKPSRCLRSSSSTKNTRKSTTSTGRAPGAKLTQQTDSDDSSATNDSSESESCGETVIQKESGKPSNPEQQKKLTALSSSDQKARSEISQSHRALRSSVDVTPSYTRKIHPNRIVDSSEEDLSEDEAVKANKKKPASSSQSADEIPCGQQSPVCSQQQSTQASNSVPTTEPSQSSTPSNIEIGKGESFCADESKESSDYESSDLSDSKEAEKVTKLSVLQQRQKITASSDSTVELDDKASDRRRASCTSRQQEAKSSPCRPCHEKYSDSPGNKSPARKLVEKNQASSQQQECNKFAGSSGPKEESAHNVLNGQQDASLAPGETAASAVADGKPARDPKPKWKSVIRDVKLNASQSDCFAVESEADTVNLSADDESPLVQSQRASSLSQASTVMASPERRSLSSQPERMSVVESERLILRPSRTDRWPSEERPVFKLPQPPETPKSSTSALPSGSDGVGTSTGGRTMSAKKMPFRGASPSGRKVLADEKKVLADEKQSAATDENNVSKSGSDEDVSSDGSASSLSTGHSPSKPGQVARAMPAIGDATESTSFSEQSICTGPSAVKRKRLEGIHDTQDIASDVDARHTRRRSCQGLSERSQGLKTILQAGGLHKKQQPFSKTQSPPLLRSVKNKAAREEIAESSQSDSTDASTNRCGQRGPGRRSHLTRAVKPPEAGPAAGISNRSMQCERNSERASNDTDDEDVPNGRSRRSSSREQEDHNVDSKLHRSKQACAIKLPATKSPQGRQQTVVEKKPVTKSDHESTGEDTAELETYNKRPCLMLSNRKMHASSVSRNANESSSSTDEEPLSKLASATVRVRKRQLASEVADSVPRGTSFTKAASLNANESSLSSDEEPLSKRASATVRVRKRQLASRVADSVPLGTSFTKAASLNANESSLSSDEKPLSKRASAMVRVRKRQLASKVADSVPLGTSFTKAASLNANESSLSSDEKPLSKRASAMVRVRKRQLASKVADSVPLGTSFTKAASRNASESSSSSDEEELPLSKMASATIGARKQQVTSQAADSVPRGTPFTKAAGAVTSDKNAATRDKETAASRMMGSERGKTTESGDSDSEPRSARSKSSGLRQMPVRKAEPLAKARTLADKTWLLSSPANRCTFTKSDSNTMQGREVQQRSREDECSNTRISSGKLHCSTPRVQTSDENGVLQAEEVRNSSEGISSALLSVPSSLDIVQASAACSSLIVPSTSRRLFAASVGRVHTAIPGCESTTQLGRHMALTGASDEDTLARLSQASDNLNGLTQMPRSSFASSEGERSNLRSSARRRSLRKHQSPETMEQFVIDYDEQVPPSFSDTDDDDDPLFEVQRRINVAISTADFDRSVSSLPSPPRREKQTPQNTPPSNNTESEKSGQSRAGRLSLAAIRAKSSLSPAATSNVANSVTVTPRHTHHGEGDGCQQERQRSEKSTCGQTERKHDGAAVAAATGDMPNAPAVRRSARISGHISGCASTRVTRNSAKLTSVPQETPPSGHSRSLGLLNEEAKPTSANETSQLRQAPREGNGEAAIQKRRRGHDADSTPGVSSQSLNGDSSDASDADERVTPVKVVAERIEDTVVRAQKRCFTCSSCSRSFSETTPKMRDSETMTDESSFRQGEAPSPPSGPSKRRKESDDNSSSPAKSVSSGLRSSRASRERSESTGRIRRETSLQRERTISHQRGAATVTLSTVLRPRRLRQTVTAPRRLSYM